MARFYWKSGRALPCVTHKLSQHGSLFNWIRQSPRCGAELHTSPGLLWRMAVDDIEQGMHVMFGSCLCCQGIDCFKFGLADQFGVVSRLSFEDLKLTDHEPCVKNVTEAGKLT